MKLRIKSMIWNIRKKKNSIRTARRKKNLKNEDSLRSLWDNFKCINIQFIGVPEEEEEQEMANLFENKMKENYLIW